LTFDANLDAMHYFVQEIFPKVVAANPATTLKITGKTTGIAANAMPVHPNLTLTGYLTDIRPTIAQSYLSVVPLRIGGGTRLKILESLALGTPVITTSKGVEGLNLAPDAGIMIADTPDAFANAILMLQRNPALRQQLSLAGRAAVQSYDWQRVGASLHTLIDTIMHPLAERQIRTFA
jgi:glycosyltransferase involved in cell wall biosynthesis